MDISTLVVSAMWLLLPAVALAVVLLALVLGPGRIHRWWRDRRRRSEMRKQ